MHYNFILIAFSSRGTPPLVNRLKNVSGDYKFSPLASEGFVYTIDTALWSSYIGDDSSTFCPDCSTITQAMKLAENDNCFFIAGLTHLAEFDPPGSPDVHIPLMNWTQFLEESDNMQLTEVGFDVVDQWTGISALSNIGYTTDDLLLLENEQLQVNQFGLFDTEGEATEYANFATVIAPEHAPFVPLKVLVRIPKT